MRSTIAHFEIPADDPERAVNFYRKLFGWKIDHMPVGDMDYWFVQTVPTDEMGKVTEAGANGGILKRNHPDQPPVNLINVENLDDSANLVEAGGGQVVVPKFPVPGIGWIMYIKDTERNLIGLYQPDPSAAM